MEKNEGGCRNKGKEELPRLPHGPFPTQESAFPRLVRSRGFEAPFRSQKAQGIAKITFEVDWLQTLRGIPAPTRVVMVENKHISIC